MFVVVERLNNNSYTVEKLITHNDGRSDSLCITTFMQYNICAIF